MYWNHSSQVAETYSVVPRGTFVSLNQSGLPNNDPKCFRARFAKRP